MTGTSVIRNADWALTGSRPAPLAPFALGRFGG